MTRPRLTAAILFALCFAAGLGSAHAAECGSDRVEQSADLPRVLIIGDSISIGYTPAVQRHLDGVAEVIHAPGNNAYSAFGLANASEWVGHGGWNVIYFNHGIWDVQLLEGKHLVRSLTGRETRVGAPLANYATLYFSRWQRRTTPDEYIRNIEGLLDILEPAAAKVVFATTTPWTTYGVETEALIQQNNASARTLMHRRGVLVDDLHALARENLSRWHSADGLHFNEQGNEGLGAAVAATITRALRDACD
jgi:hypothetical protein